MCFCENFRKQKKAFYATKATKFVKSIFVFYFHFESFRKFVSNFSERFNVLLHSLINNKKRHLQLFFIGSVFSEEMSRYVVESLMSKEFDFL
jgi:hypothetical protein